MKVHRRKHISGKYVLFSLDIFENNYELEWEVDIFSGCSVSCSVQSILGCVCEYCLSDCDCVVCNLAFSLPQWFSTGPATVFTFVFSLSSNISENLNNFHWFLKYSYSSVIYNTLMHWWYSVVAFSCFSKGYINSFCLGMFSEFFKENHDHTCLLLGML